MSEDNKLTQTETNGFSCEMEREGLRNSGFRVRLGIKSGNWRCSSCQGKTMGSNLFQPKCDYCQKI